MRDDSTLADFDRENQAVPRKAFSRIALGTLTLVVLAGAVSVLGVHTSTATATANGYTLSFEYPRTARAGLDVTWRATIKHPGGFDGPITLSVTADQFDIYETQGFEPEPNSETRDGDTLYLSFDPPPAGDLFVVSYDAYIQPSSQLGRSGDLSVLVHGEPAVTVHFATWLAP